ncbi:serine/threonine-protein kinase [Sorangium sp. So ce861]|uniref:serine/threonine-protein kinase n=1 Tax=Sorangium sp. So ce861 TaxID=3133323 RepID=UPI003F635ADD
METPVQPGDVLLGKYTIERVLGQGGMGTVLAARHRELGELFAIKLLLPQALANTNATERFVREARAAVRLKGDHVVRVHDVGKLETGAPYMVMEHLVGSDLQQVVLDRGPLPVDEAVDYVLQACEAVAEAHAHGIVHRDLKPANLFLTRRPNGAPWVKVLDFGISKQLSPDHIDLTKSGALIGSPFYMSPEQMVRARRVDTRSDIWSMGVVLHHLVTGKLPFPAEDLTEVVAHVLQEEPIPPSQQRPGLPGEVDTVVALCLQKRPEHRFQTIDELAAALRVLRSTGAPAPVATASIRAGEDRALALADTEVALAQTPPRPAQTTADGPAPGADQEMGLTVSGSDERPAPSARRSGSASGVLRSFARVAPIAGAALAVLAIGSGWLALRQQAAPAAAASAAPAAPAPVVTSTGDEAPPPAAEEAAEDTAATGAAESTPPRAAAPSSSAAAAPVEPAASASAPPRGPAPVRRPGSAAVPRPAVTAAATAAGNVNAPAPATAPPPPMKYEGLY